jgi:hypothetical protein
MDLFWNKRLSRLKFCTIFVTMLPKTIYSHTWNIQVPQLFIVLIILKTTKNFLHNERKTSAGFVHIGILLLWSLWRILRWRRVVWGGDFGEGTRGGEWCWRGCAVGGFLGGVVWGGDFGEGTHGGEWCWRSSAVGGFWEGGVVWGGDFREWTCGGEWYWRGCVVGGFWGEGGVIWGGDFWEWTPGGEWC